MYCEHGKMESCAACKADYIVALEAELTEQVAAKHSAMNFLDAERAAHARTQAEAAAKHHALVHAYEVLRSPTVRPSGHSGDEDSSNCDEDCAKCAVEGAIAHADEALDDASVGRRAIAERVPLWRELERIGDEIKGTGGENPEDGPFSRLRGVLRKLVAHDSNCIHCGYPENCHEDNPLFKDHAYKVRT